VPVPVPAAKPWPCTVSLIELRQLCNKQCRSSYRQRARASPCWQYLSIQSEPSKTPSAHQIPATRRAPPQYVIPWPTPRWPRRCSSEHGSQFQYHASAVYGISTTGDCCRSSRATALRSWYGSMPLDAHTFARLTHQQATEACTAPAGRRFQALLPLVVGAQLGHQLSCQSTFLPKRS
jgi:hypothetical protein